MKLYIPADTIKALLTIALKNDIRYCLNGVLVDHSANGTVLVVTDGHRLLAVPVTPDQEVIADYGQTIIPRDTLAAVKGDMGGNVAITLDASGITVAGATTATCQPLDGRFPNWRMVVPRTASGAVAQFNPDYIGEWGKVAKLLCGKGAQVAIAHNGDGAARVILGESSAVAVIMPVRGVVPGTLDNPAWLTAAE